MSDWLLWLRKTFLNVYYIYCFQRSYHFYCNCNWITSGGVWIFSCIHDIISFDSSPSRSWKPNRSRYCYWATASNKLVSNITRRLTLMNSASNYKIKGRLICSLTINNIWYFSLHFKITNDISKNEAFNSSIQEN